LPTRTRSGPTASGRCRPAQRAWRPERPGHQPPGRRRTGRLGPLADGDEIGWHEVTRTAPDPVFDALPHTFKAFQWHGYGFQVPPGATELATGPRGPQAFRLGENAYGIQFHAEVDAPTVQGWIRDYGPEAGIDAGALQTETDREIERWNELGRRLLSRFLQLPARPVAGPR
jgi:hypothetical protein